MKVRGGYYHSDFRLSDGSRIRKALKAKTKADAIREEAELIAFKEAQLRGLPVIPQSTREEVQKLSGITVEKAYKGAMVDREEWRTSKSPRTIETNYAHVAAELGSDRDLSTVDRDVVREYTRKMQADGLSPSTINQRLSVISVLLKWAEEETNGAIQVLKMPRQKSRKGRIRTISRQEEANILSWFRSATRKKDRPRAKDEDMAEFVEFLVDTGFRPSEALRLRSGEVLWDSGMVPAWENKADHPRLVPMTKRVRAILEGRKKLDKPWGMFTVDSADDHWEAMRKGIGVDMSRDPEFVLYALRHTCASRLAAAGMDAFRIQKWMGHKKIETTLRYVTLFAPDLKQLADVLDRGHSQGQRKSSRRAVQNVPKMCPKGSPPAPERRTGGPPERGSSKGFRPDERTGPPVGSRLLIRRSLVRVQVGEPESTGVPEKEPQKGK